MPDVGQYTSPEPLHRSTIARGFYGPLAYSYAAGRPLSFTDPDGRFLIEDYYWWEHQLTDMFGDREDAKREGREKAADLGLSGGFNTGDACSHENALRHCIGSCRLMRNDWWMRHAAWFAMAWHEMANGGDDSRFDRFNNKRGKECSQKEGTCVEQCVDMLKEGRLGVGVNGVCSGRFPDGSRPDPYWPPAP